MLEKGTRLATRFPQGRDDVQIERLADGARLLGAIKHGDRPGGDR